MKKLMQTAKDPARAGFAGILKGDVINELMKEKKIEKEL